MPWQVIEMEVEGAGRDVQAFYRHEREGRRYKTAQINPLVYRKALKKHWMQEMMGCI